MSFEKLFGLLMRSTEGSNRLECLLHPFFRRNLTDDQFFTILRDEWEGLHNVSESVEELREIFPLYGPVRSMMTPDENDVYDALPYINIAYRGCDAGWLDGVSYSSNKKVANWFAFYTLTQAEQPTLITAHVRKDLIMAVKLRRDEEEIITFCPDIQAVEPADPVLCDEYNVERMDAQEAARRLARLRWPSDQD